MRQIRWHANSQFVTYAMLRSCRAHGLVVQRLRAAPEVNLDRYYAAVGSKGDNDHYPAACMLGAGTLRIVRRRFLDRKSRSIGVRALWLRLCIARGRGGSFRRVPKRKRELFLRLSVGRRN